MEIPSLPEGCTIDSVPLFAGTSMSTAAWIITGNTGLTELLRPMDKRGTDDLIPGVGGVLRFGRRPTLSRRLLPMAFFGTHDPDGAPFTDHDEGAQANIREFQAAVVDDGDPLPIVVRLRGGLVLEGEIVVEDFPYGDVAGGCINAVLDLSIATQLTESGS